MKRDSLHMRGASAGAWFLEAHEETTRGDLTTAARDAIPGKLIASWRLEPAVDHVDVPAMVAIATAYIINECETLRIHPDDAPRRAWVEAWARFAEAVTASRKATP